MSCKIHSVYNTIAAKPLASDRTRTQLFCLLDSRQNQKNQIDTMAQFSFYFAPQPDCMLLTKLPINICENIIRLTIVLEDDDIVPEIARAECLFCWPQSGRDQSKLYERST
jgi:hypothetical protein